MMKSKAGNTKMPLYPYMDKFPVLGKDCYVAPTAVLIGDIKLHDGVSIWFGAVLRGDVSPIVVGARTNIQDNTVIHGEDGYPTTIGEDVTIGHSAIIHAATISDRVLVGMGAVLLSRSFIGEETIIAAQALVTEDVQIPGGSLAMGSPARVKRALSSEEKRRILESALHYVENAARFREEKS